MRLLPRIARPSNEELETPGVSRTVIMPRFLLISLKGGGKSCGGEGREKKKKTERKLSESEARSVREMVWEGGPAVLFSAAVQSGDMWLPRQAAQSGGVGGVGVGG